MNEVVRQNQETGRTEQIKRILPKTINKMNKMLTTSFVSIALIFMSCEKDENSCVPAPVNNNEPCIDSSLIDGTSSCLDIYEPVCGCDGVTYGNSCYATIFYGVSSYVEGECCD